MRKIEYLDQPPTGWHALDVVKRKSRKWDWGALMIDVHPDELKHCWCDVAFLYVHPRDYRPEGGRRAQEAWVRVPGKHRTKKAAWVAFQCMLSEQRRSGAHA